MIKYDKISYDGILLFILKNKVFLTISSRAPWVWPQLCAGHLISVVSSFSGDPSVSPGCGSNDQRAMLPFCAPRSRDSDYTYGISTRYFYLRRDTSRVTGHICASVTFPAQGYFSRAIFSPLGF